MSVELFGNNIEPACKHCESARLHIDGKHEVLCERRGVVGENYHCRKYVYDPTKRIPKPLKPLERFDMDDFSIE